MTKQYKAGEVPTCPHCDVPFEGPVEDYVVQGPHGRLNHNYEDECGDCYRTIAIKKLDETTYEVAAVSRTR
jgi:hypothetical protein